MIINYFECIAELDKNYFRLEAHTTEQSKAKRPEKYTKKKEEVEDEKTKNTHISLSNVL